MGKKPFMGKKFSLKMQIITLFLDVPIDIWWNGFPYKHNERLVEGKIPIENDFLCSSGKDSCDPPPTKDI